MADWENTGRPWIAATTATVPTPSPSPGPPPRSGVDKGNDAWSNSWIARGKWAVANPKLSGYVPQLPPTTPTTPTTPTPIKTADTSIFTYAFFDGQPDYAIEADLSLKSLTGNEILQVAHRQNFYTNNAVLNNNILDIVDSKNFYLPTEIIKLQKANFSYFQNNLTSYSALLTNSVVTVSIPVSGIEQSYKLQVETFAPNYVKNDTIYT